MWKQPPAVLEKGVERLRESTAALTQRVSELVAKAESASKVERDAVAAMAALERSGEETALMAATTAREEEAARCRQEMETALAEVSSPWSSFLVLVLVFFLRMYK